MKRNEELIKNTLILGIGQLIPKLMTIITLPILTAYLSTSEFGSYDLMITLAGLLIPIITMQIFQGVFRHLVSANEEKDKRKYVTAAIAYILGACVVFTPLAYLGLRLFNIGHTTSLYVCAVLLAEAIYYVVGQVCRGLGHNIYFSVGAIIFSVTNMLAIIMFVVIFRWGIDGVILSIICGYMLAVAYMFVFSRAYKLCNKSYFSISALKQLLKFSIPLVPNSLSVWVVNLSNRLVVTGFLGSSANGVFSVANRIPNMYNTAYNIFNLAWMESASKASDEGNPDEYYSKMYDMLFKFLLGIMLVLIALTPILFKVLVNEKYREAYYQIPILYVGVFLSSIVFFYGGIYIALKRTKQVGYSSIMGAVINLVINLLFIKWIGLYAASISTVISYMAILLYRMYDLNKVISIKYNYIKMVSELAILIVSVIMCMVNNAVTFLSCFVIAILYNLIENKFLIVLW